MKNLILLFTLLTSACLTFAGEPEPRFNLQFEGNLINRILNQVPFPYYIKYKKVGNKNVFVGGGPLHSNRSATFLTYPSAIDDTNAEPKNNLGEVEEELRLEIIAELEKKLAVMQNNNPNREEVLELLTFFKDRQYYDPKDYYQGNGVSNRSWWNPIKIIKVIGDKIGDGIREIGDKVKDGVDEAGNKIKKFGNKIEAAAKKTAQFVTTDITRVTVVFEKQPVFNPNSMTLSNLQLKMEGQISVCLVFPGFVKIKCKKIDTYWIRPEHNPVFNMHFERDAKTNNEGKETDVAIKLVGSPNEKIRLRFKFTVFGIPVSVPIHLLPKIIADDVSISKSKATFGPTIIQYNPEEHIHNISVGNQQAFIGIKNIDAKNQNQKINFAITLNGCTTYTDRNNNRLSTAITRNSNSDCKPHQ